MPRGTASNPVSITYNLSEIFSEIRFKIIKLLFLQHVRRN
jgi:hypothetical protein